MYPVVHASSNGAPPKKPPPFNYYLKDRAPTTTPESSEETIPDNYSFFHFQSTPNPPTQKQVSHKPTSIPFYGSSTPRNPFLIFQSLGNFFQVTSKAEPSKDADSVFRPSPRRPDDSKSPDLKPHIPKPTILVPVNGKHVPYNRPQVTTLQPTVIGSSLSQNLTPKAPVTYAFQVISDKPSTKHLSSTESPHTFVITKALSHHFSLNPTVQITTPIVKPTPSTFSAHSYAPNQKENQFGSAIKLNHLAQVNDKAIQKNIADIGVSLLKNVSKPVILNITSYLKHATTVKPVTEEDEDYYYEYESDEKTETPTKNTFNNTSVSNKNSKLPKPSIKLIQSVNKIPSYIKENPLEPEEETEESEEEYYDDEEYEDYDDDRHYAPPPPRLNAPYRPASETAAPRPITTTTSRPLRPSTPWGGLSSTRPTYTTSSPYTTTSSSIPPIIKFPDDPFQQFKLGMFPRYLNKSTLRPYTVRQRVRPTLVPTEEPTTEENNKKITNLAIPTTTPIVPTRKTTRKIYTVRPNRGNLKWKHNKNNTETKNKNRDNTNTSSRRGTKGRLELDEKYANR